ncbi:MAG: PD-(D/E)XK nuclease family protein, partial [Prochlorotrichaceae cyanobacterium]
KWEDFKEEQARKWDEQNRKWEQQNRQWDELKEELQRDREAQDRKWDEQHHFNQEILQEIKALHRKHDSTIGALGSRWGLNSEASFRNALKGILEESFNVQVVNVTLFDSECFVFKRPDQVELDIIIQNGIIIACEIKSSMSKADLYTFDRKVEFYENHTGRSVNRKIVVSPMIAPNALEVAEGLGIEVYSSAEDVSPRN